MTQESAAPTWREYWPRRFTLVGLCFAGTFICYIDRVNISVAIIPMASQFGWDRTLQGLILSAFFYGYLTTQIAGGWLADRYGGKSVLGAGVLLWSLFTVLTPPAAAAGIGVLFLARVGMGMGEGVTFPSVYSLFARWVPQRERTRAIGLNASGIPLGTVAALLVTPVIVVGLGWPMAFYLFGIAGVIWYGLWHFLVASSPEHHRSIHPSELQHIREGTPEPGDAPKLPWRKLLSRAPVWAIIVCHFSNNWGGYVILSWLPTYVNQALGVDLSAVGLYTMIPFLVSFLALNAAGWVSDFLLRRGLGITAARKLMQTVGFTGPAIFLILIGGVTSAPTAILYMSCASALGAFAMGGFGVNHLDIGPRYAGLLMGVSNTAGTIPGIVGVTVSGLILDLTGSWALVFGVAAGVYMLGLVVWLLFATGERVFD
jgi:ACS family sodium-dependent inorganic phosphate cotransporter